MALLQQDDSSLEQDLILHSLLQHFQQQSAVAIQQLSSKEDTELWPIERYLLVAEIARDMAVQHINETNIESALNLLRQASHYLVKAQSIARSHPEVHKKLCQTESQIAQLSTQFQNTQIESCDDLLVILPDSPEAILLVANAYAQIAKSWLNHSHSPLTLFQKINDLLNHNWDSESDEMKAQSKQILGHVSTTEGLWEMYSNQEFESSLLKAVKYHQQAAEYQTHNYNTQFELALAWFNLANFVDGDINLKQQRFEQVINILERLKEHADATVLTTAKLVLFYTEYAYQSYQQGYSADQPLKAADKLVQQTLQISAENTYAQLAAATLYWTYTDYLVLENQNPEIYLQQAIDLFEKVISKNPDWTHRFNQISAMLSGVTYYLEQGQTQTTELSKIEQKIQQLAQSVSDDISLNSHLGYFYNMQAINQINQGKDPSSAIKKALEFNTSCLASPVDGRTCYGQLATSSIVEQRWKLLHPEHQLLQSAETTDKLTDGLSKHPKHFILEAQLGRLLWISAQWKNLSAAERLLILQQAQQHLTNALTNNQLLRFNYAKDLKSVEEQLSL